METVTCLASSRDIFPAHEGNKVKARINNIAVLNRGGLINDRKKEKPKKMDCFFTLKPPPIRPERFS
jgi:hypothetical protein